MGLFSKIFGNRTKSNSTRHDWPDEYKRVQDFNNKLALLLGRDRFIAKSDYASIVSEYSELPVFFDALEKSGMLFFYTIEDLESAYDKINVILNSKKQILGENVEVTVPGREKGFMQKIKSIFSKK